MLFAKRVLVMVIFKLIFWDFKYFRGLPDFLVSNWALIQIFN